VIEPTFAVKNLSGLSFQALFMGQQFGRFTFVSFDPLFLEKNEEFKRRYKPSPVHQIERWHTSIVSSAGFEEKAQVQK